MKHLRKFNESTGKAEFKEKEFTENMMSNTLSFFSCMPRPIDLSLSRLFKVIKDTLNDDIYNTFFPEEFYKTDDSKLNIPLDFATSCINHKDLSRMFDNVAIQEGSDLEDEFVSALEINNTLVLLLNSERGSQIRVEDSNMSLKKLEDIVRCLCEIYNYLY